MYFTIKVVIQLRYELDMTSDWPAEINYEEFPDIDTYL